MEKIDFKKTLKHLYQPSVKEIACVDVPEIFKRYATGGTGKVENDCQATNVMKMRT